MAHLLETKGLTKKFGNIGREALEQIGHILDECGIDEAGIV